jgi:hypothetical protein
MSMYTIALWSGLGLVIGAGAIIAFAGSSVFRGMLFRQILRSNKDGWALTQRGTRYTFDPLDREEDANCYKIDRDGNEEYVEDAGGMMHTLEGVPLGLRVEDDRPMVDIEAAEATHAMDEKAPDGGELATPVPGDPEYAVDDLGDIEPDEAEERLIIGYKEGERRKLMYINPFELRDKVPDLVDLRNVPKVLRHDSDPDTPRKAAKNAVEAERAGQKWDDIKTWAKNSGYFLLGAIATYIGTTSTGGGGGGGAEAVDVGLTALPPMFADVAVQSIPMVM